MTQIDPTVFGCVSSQVVCAGGAQLAIDPAVGFGDVWITLSSSLDLRLINTTFFHEGDNGGPALYATPSALLPFEQYTGGPGNITLPVGLPDTRHLIRIAAPHDSPGDGLCYAAVYIASPSGGTQSLVVLLECRIGSAGCGIRTIGTVHSVPDSVVDMNIIENHVVFQMQADAGVKTYRLGPLSSIAQSFRGGGIREWGGVALMCDQAELIRPARFVRSPL